MNVSDEVSGNRRGAGAPERAACLLRHPQVRGRVGHYDGTGGGRARLPAHRPATRRRRLARHRLATRVRRPGPIRPASSSSCSTRCSGRASRSRSSPSTPWGRPSCGSAPTSRSRRTCPGSSRASSTSPSATPSPARAPTSPRCGPSARLDGGEWVVNGSKVFTSGANQADLVWLACRTEPDAPKHKGLSILMVPTDSAGVPVHADRHRRRHRHDRDLLRRRPRPGREHRR